ncbi:MAG: ribonuclease III [Methylovirgula sp.]|uniref:ribonuclease III n=1 Tax=Methylovirgula sp. TaxID=1978224 RepID=UPI00307617F5
MAPKLGDLATLETSLGYKFVDRDLAHLALTHVSAAAARDGSYQRLEFLGDRVLGLVVSEMLYVSFPAADEGELSRRLADLVRRESCAEVAREWGLENHVRLGESERQSGAKDAILADICESIIGAVFLDGGYAAAKEVVAHVFAPRMRAPRRPLRDPKTALQEWAQARGLETPLYRETGRTGPHHAPEFTVEVVVTGFAAEAAKGGSKRNAEQAAASAFLTREGISG